MEKRPYPHNQSAADLSSSPDPACRPTYIQPIHLGIAGHRFLTDIDRLIEGIDRALQNIHPVCGERPLTLISELAEGSDMLVVSRALSFPNTSLLVVLPMPPDAYLHSFSSKTSRDLFTSLLEQAQAVVEMPPAPTVDEAYQAAGDYIVDQSDMLLVIWDGLPAQGPGGTGAVVAAARDRHLPLAWIKAGNRQPGTHQPTTLGPAQGSVSFERWVFDQDRHLPPEGANHA